MGREGAVEFMEFGFDDLRDYKNFKVIVGGMVGYIPRIIEDSAKDLGLETQPQLNAKSPCRLKDGILETLGRRLCPQ